MGKKVIAGSCVLLIVGVCLCLHVKTFVSSFPTAYVESCKEVFGEIVKPLRAFKTGIATTPVTDYSYCEDIQAGDDTISWKFVDDNYRHLTLVLSHVGGKYHTEVKYITLTETEEAISHIVKLMFGPDVSYDVSTEAINGYVSVIVQGNEYRWKDGTLERVH